MATIASTLDTAGLAQHVVDLGDTCFVFPEPSSLEGIKDRGTDVLKMRDVGFQHPSSTSTVIADVSAVLSQASRVAVSGAMSASRSTLMRLIAGQLKPTAGTLMKVQGLRVAYVTKASLRCLEGHDKQTPTQHILSEQPEHGKEAQAGAEQLTLACGSSSQNIVEYLADFGLEPDAASHSEMGQLSQGTLAKIALAVAMLRRPHLLIIDEFEECLDSEDMQGFVVALRHYRGGVVVISKNSDFADAVTTEKWIMSDSTLRVEGGYSSKEIPAQSKAKQSANGIASGRESSQEELKRQIKQIEKRVKEAKEKPLADEDIWKLHDDLLSIKEVMMAVVKLDGVKSRNKAIFKAEKAKITTGSGSTWIASGISLCLESRIAAVGEGARSVLELLLGSIEEEAGTVTRHKALVVAHLGPHLAGKEAEAEEHVSAAMAALQAKPQVVVLDEALSNGGAGWARAFRKLLRDAGLSDFKGAVIVACDKEVTFAMRRICTEQWASVGGGKVLQQDTSGQKLHIVEDVLKEISSHSEPVLTGKKAKGGKKQGAEGNTVNEMLIEETRALSEFIFDVDIVRQARKHGWTLALLTEDANDGHSSLRGFIAYRWEGTVLYIERLATPKQFRGRGFAKVLMRWILGEAARMPQSDCTMIACSSVDTAVPFYERFGFTVPLGRQPEVNCEEDPQTFMQFCNVSLVSV